MRTPYWCVSWLIPNLGGLEAVINEAEARANELANRMPVVVADVLYVPQAGALDFYGAGSSPPRVSRGVHAVSCRIVGLPKFRWLAQRLPQRYR
jgi:hypothetical protein